jgi:hypothetical protein
LIVLPDGCPRGRADCEALARIESDDGATFICLGHNDGSTRLVQQDVLTKCVRSETCDTRENLDELDAGDEAAVLTLGLAVWSRRRLVL